MTLLNVTALMLGIFGAAYTALNALRTYFDSNIKAAVDNAKDCVDVVGEKLKTGPSLDVAVAFQSRIGAARRVWLWAHIIPIIIFTLFVIGLTVEVLLKWNEVVTPQGPPAWPWCYWAIMGMGVVDLACLLVAVLALLFLRYEDKHCLDHFRCAQDEVARSEVQRIPATPVLGTRV